MKFLIGLMIGFAVVIGCGMTYDVTRAGITENVVDVRLVELGGHEYVVASSYAPCRSLPNSQSYTYPRVSTSMVANMNITSGGSSIAIVHHVGCKLCHTH